MIALPQPDFARNVRLIGHSDQGGRVVQSVSARVDAADLIYSIDNNAELPFGLRRTTANLAQMSSRA